MNCHSLARMFRPRSVAVIGATPRVGSVGRAVLENLTRAKFPGPVYPINLSRSDVLGLPALRDVAAAPAPPDLAVICTPASTVAGVVRRCGLAGVGAVVVITAGFREIGAAGRRLEDELAAEAARWPAMRILGPNCLGVLSPRARLNASFASAMPLAGSIAFISQSGALCTAVLDWSLSANVGFSCFASLGNSLDVDFADLIDYLIDDDDTSSIVLYVESISKATEFLAAARRFSRVKPIVAYKAGRFAASAQAAASHTGAMAGNDAVYEAAFRRAGVVLVDEAEDMFDCAELLAAHRLPVGSRLAIVTNAGGPGVMAADELLRRRGTLAHLKSATIDELGRTLPPNWSHGNPVDVVGDAGPERYARAAETVLFDAQVDALLTILTPQAMSDPSAVAAEIGRVAAGTTKPVLAAWMGGGAMVEGRRLLAAAGVPTYDMPERAVRAFEYLVAYSRRRQSLDEAEPVRPQLLNAVYHDAVRVAIRACAPGAGGALNESDSKAILAAYGIEATMPRLAQSPAEAVALGREIGYPVVMKLQSPDVTHKTEVRGIETGVPDDAAARQAYDRIVDAVRLRRPDARVDGVTVQPMASSATGVELITGGLRDPTFGPVALIGAGGVLAELLGDRTLELAPLDARQAQKMLESLRAWALLAGFRGRPAVDVDSVVETLIRISYLIDEQPDVLELDVNPLLATPDGAVALDARIVVAPRSPAPREAK